jgi:hypothetical protein
METSLLLLVVCSTVPRALKELCSFIVRWATISEVSEYHPKLEWSAQYLGKALVLEFAWLLILM